MNERQQKQYNKINLFLSQFEAKIKDGEEYTHSEENITIINKYGIERIILATTIKNLKKTIDFWTFDGTMSDRQKQELKILKNIAESKNGKLISTLYSHCEKKLEFEDKAGNRFWMSGANIKSNRWSPYESGNVYNNPEYHLNILRKIAKKNGGKLISDNYIKAHEKLEFEDKDGNRFWMSANDVKCKKWSPYESGNVYNNPEYHLNILREIAKSKGGKLISDKYKGNDKKLEFEDRFKNKFWSSPNFIKIGKWSPFEIPNMSEAKCRQCIEFIFKVEFLSSWNIITRKGKRNLQLDGYNKELNFAFEYQGEQHYNFKYIRGGTLEEKKKRFLKIKENDKEKEELCKEKGITLIKIKYFANYKKDIDYLKHVIKEIKKNKNERLNEYLQQNFDDFKFNYNRFPSNQKYWDELNEIAESKDGKLISDKYIDSKTKLEFEDKAGNRFWCKITEIRKGQWSPYESNRTKDPEYHLKVINDLAKKNGFILISTNYVNHRAKLEFINQNGKRVFYSSTSFKQKFKQ